MFRAVANNLEILNYALNFYILCLCRYVGDHMSSHLSPKSVSVSVSVSECDIRENFDMNECPNIFVSTKLHEWISEYIHTNFFDTNECPNKYSYWKLHEYSNIFEYSSRFYTLTHSPTKEMKEAYRNERGIYARIHDSLLKKIKH